MTKKLIWFTQSDVESPESKVYTVMPLVPQPGMEVYLADVCTPENASFFGGVGYAEGAVDPARASLYVHKVTPEFSADAYKTPGALPPPVEMSLSAFSHGLICIPSVPNRVLDNIARKMPRASFYQPIDFYKASLSKSINLEIEKSLGSAHFLPSVVCRTADDARAFQKAHGPSVLKILEEEAGFLVYGGQGVFRPEEIPDLDAFFGKIKGGMLCTEFIPDIAKIGDMRVYAYVDGKGEIKVEDYGMLRHAKEGSWKCNVCSGGSEKTVPVTAAQKILARRVMDWAHKTWGAHLLGLDEIGDGSKPIMVGGKPYRVILTEINPDPGLPSFQRDAIANGIAGSIRGFIERTAGGQERTLGNFRGLSASRERS